MPRLGLLLLALLLAGAAASSASACPAPMPGGPRCTKYDHMFEQQRLAAYAATYVRTTRAVLPPRTSGKRALRNLVGSTWTARGPAVAIPVLGLLDARNVPATVDDAVHNTLVGGVTWRRDHYVVAIDAIEYSVRRCRDDRGLLTTCLVRGGQ